MVAIVTLTYKNIGKCLSLDKISDDIPGGSADFIRRN